MARDRRPPHRHDDRLAAQQADARRSRATAIPTSTSNSERERLGGPTFAAVTSRSYHPGGVNTLFGDGSVKFIKSTINGLVWRGLGTVAGGEVVSSDSY